MEEEFDAAPVSFKLLGRGTSGSVYFPAVTCAGTIDETQVSKVLRVPGEEDFEAAAASLLRHFLTPSDLRHFLIATESCPVPRRLVTHGAAAAGQTQVVSPFGGKTLKAAAEKCTTKSEILEVMRSLETVFEAVQALNRAGLIHCDIKPDNIVVKREADGRLVTKLIDFGLFCGEVGGTVRLPTGSVNLAPFGEFDTPYYFWPLEVGCYAWCRVTPRAVREAKLAAKVEEYSKRHVDVYNMVCPWDMELLVEEIQLSRAEVRVATGVGVRSALQLVEKRGGMRDEDCLAPLHGVVPPSFLAQCLRHPDGVYMLELLQQGIPVCFDKVDVYSLGCTLLDLWVEWHHTVQLPPAFKALGADMVRLNAFQRPSAGEALARFREMVDAFETEAESRGPRVPPPAPTTGGRSTRSVKGKRSASRTTKVRRPLVLPVYGHEAPSKPRTRKKPARRVSRPLRGRK